MNGTGYPDACGECDTRPPDWTITRRGDVARTWACEKHLHDLCVDLQRDHEVTQIVVEPFAKKREWAEIGELLRKVDG